MQETLQKFKQGDVQILLGTQMVAKGLNFPGVKLVGILQADMGLNLPDFRSAERTFALIVQVSGRAGRYAPDGKVLIQSFSPGHPAIDLAARGDLETFYTRELETREFLEFPPFSRMIRLVYRGQNRQQVLTAAHQMEGQLSSVLAEQGEVLGPAECPLGKISGKYRYQLLLRSVSLNRLHGVIARCSEALTLPAGLYLEIDVDPVSLL